MALASLNSLFSFSSSNDLPGTHVDRVLTFPGTREESSDETVQIGSELRRNYFTRLKL